MTHSVNLTLLETTPQMWPASAPSRPSGIGGVKGRNMNDISSPGSPVLWTGSFTF